MGFWNPKLVQLAVIVQQQKYGKSYVAPGQNQSK